MTFGFVEVLILLVVAISLIAVAIMVGMALGLPTAWAKVRQMRASKSDSAVAAPVADAVHR